MTEDEPENAEKLDEQFTQAMRRREIRQILLKMVRVLATAVPVGLFGNIASVGAQQHSLHLMLVGIGGGVLLVLALWLGYLLD